MTQVSAIAARWRLLPLFMIVAAAILAFRTGEFAGDLARLAGAAPARAQEAQDAQEAEESVPPPPAADDAQPDDAPISLGVSRAEMTLLEDLRRRREELDERERQAALREQLLLATEQRIDRKIADLRKIEEHVEKLVARHEEQQDARIANIVKVYETMKPKDAAPVFQRLALEIQADVATRMKDAKMAALLAEMSPESAEILTTHLATRDTLPGEAEILAGGNSP